MNSLKTLDFLTTIPFDTFPETFPFESLETCNYPEQALRLQKERQT